MLVSYIYHSGFRYPTTIDNSELEEKLVNQNNKDRLRKNDHFYLLSKELWDFIFSIYGGGPAIVMHN